MTIYPFRQKKIPTILGLALLVVAVAVVALVTQGAAQVTKLFSQAETIPTPSSRVTAANITDISFTVFWTTDVSTSAVVSYGQTSAAEGGIAVDERDLASPGGKYLTHFVRVTNLHPSTKYYFKVGSGKTFFGDPSANNNAFSLTTGAALSSPPNIDPLFGKTEDANGNPVGDMIALWESENATKIAALVKNDGSYVLPVALARNADLSDYPFLAVGTAEKISFNAASLGSAVLTCQWGKDHLLPTVKLGQNIDCLTTSSQSTATASGSGSFRPPPKSAPNIQLNISPGQTVDSPSPTFQGTAPPNQPVNITVHSATDYSGTVIAGPDGSWSWTPPANLSPGQHTVTITVIGQNGSPQTVTRTFYVASGSPILPITSGTPSGQTYHTCSNNACVVVSGTGTDQCTSDSDCVQAPPATHKACQNKACVVVSGAGADQCTSNASCQPPPPPPPTGATENTLIFLTLGLAFLTLGAVIFLNGRLRP